MRKLLALTILLTIMLVPAKAQMIFSPQWTPQAQFAGYYVALEKGFYKNAGVDVKIVHPSQSESSFHRIQSGKSQATTLQLMQAMTLIDKGTPLVNILKTSMNNSTVIVSRRGKNPLTQKGQKIGVYNAGFDEIARIMSQREKLNYKWLTFISPINAFGAGAVDMTLAMSYNEFYQLKQTGLDLSEKNVYRFCDHGYNIQEDGVYVTRAYYLKNKELCQKFAEATKKGWRWAADHERETLEIVMKYVRKYHVATNPVLQQLMLEEIIRLQKDKQTGRQSFILRRDMVEKANRLMLDAKMINHSVTYNQLIGR